VWRKYRGESGAVRSGWAVLVANGIWIIYRIVKGWLNLNDNKPMYAV